ncbi:MAG: hypothetical protein KF729_13780 [Sandaracinaceae bacterium]|nr:hypothetical protein [Sandaracinaceae bacterium]
MHRTLHLVLAIALGTGCALDVATPEDLAAFSAVEGLALVPRADWERAPAGCEGAAVASLRLAGCEGEPALGALVDGAGAVVCVDALGALYAQLRATATPSALPSDPSPQPSHPEPLLQGNALHPISAESPPPMPLSARPVVTRDPTPTPVIDERLLARLGRAGSGPDKEDPTPTPTTEQ